MAKVSSRSSWAGLVLSAVGTVHGVWSDVVLVESPEPCLPWRDASCSGDPVSVALIVTTTEGNALNRNQFNRAVWIPAFKRAGVERTRENGCHALRHFFASVLLGAGENIKAV